MINSRVILGSIILLLISTPLASGGATVTNNSSSLSITITDAYYLDANGDGYFDDVKVLFSLELDSTGRTQFEIYFTLTLPSGSQTTYGYRINTVYSHLDGTMMFYNHALESGWYNIEADVFLLNGGVAHTDTNMDFDPPGETSGGDPEGAISFS